MNAKMIIRAVKTVLREQKKLLQRFRRKIIRGYEEHKLIISRASDDLAAFSVIFQKLADRHQNIASLLLPEQVIDQAEPAHIRHDQHVGPVRLIRKSAPDCALQPVAVQCAGEDVVEHQKIQIVLVFLDAPRAVPFRIDQLQRAGKARAVLRGQSERHRADAIISAADPLAPGKLRIDPAGSEARAVRTARPGSPDAVTRLAVFDSSVLPDRKSPALIRIDDPCDLIGLPQFAENFLHLFAGKHIPAVQILFQVIRIVLHRSYLRLLLTRERFIRKPRKVQYSAIL